MGKEVTEINGCQRFLGWYKKRHKRSYIPQKADIYFPDIKDSLNWDFVAYESDNPQDWIGIEVKELATMKDIPIQSEFWGDLCLELIQDLKGKGIEGKFGILPPDFNLKSRERARFRKAFIEVLRQKSINMKINETVNIGPDIADKFANWPREKIQNFNEYDKWGDDRPSEIQITKSANSGYELSCLTSPIIGGGVPQSHQEAFNEVFKLENGVIKANRQLELAKKMGAKETILLLACNPFVDEGLIKNWVQNLDRHRISDIDYIYLVDIYNKGRVVKIYPG